MQYYDFECGCRVPVTSDKLKKQDNIPSLTIPYEDICYALNYGITCPKVWELFKTGKTKGIFQLETHTGQSWCYELKPDSVEELATLSSLIRPGSSNAKLDGKSMTQHYVDRKHGKEPIDSFGNVLDDILGPTYNVMAFQEQAMQIAVEIAGFDEMSADTLRKSIGKKDAKLMAKVKKGFLKGCKKVGIVNEEKAAEIFGWIEESQKYSFNKSHGVSYSFLSYLNAWVKIHFPLHFYCSWIAGAKDKQKTFDEVRDLVMDGKRFNVQINTPSVKTLKNNHGFACLDVDKLALGIKGIKKLGNNVVLALFNKISEVEVSLGPVEKWTWYQFLMYLGDEITSTTMNGLIIAGVLDQYGVDRQKMLFEFNILRSLTKLELKGVVECRDTCKTLEGVLSYVRDNKSRRPGKIQDLINSIYNPPYSLEDTKRWVITQERNSFGVPITYTSVDVHSHIQSDTTCKEFVDGKGGDMVIQGEIGRCKEIVIKNGKSKGKKMGFLDLEDETDRISCVAFSDTWEEYMDYIYNGNIVCIAGKRSDRNGLIVNKIYEI